MTQVENGNTVQVHYTGTLKDGTQFDSSAGRDPLEFTVGSGQIIPGFEEAVMGMKPGDEKTVTIPSEQAYGPHHEELLLKVERELIPDHVQPELGQQLELRQDDGRAIAVFITKITDDNITLDANHPLAGKDLVFNIELVAVA